MGAEKGSREPLPLPSQPCRPLALSGFLSVLNPLREPVHKLLKHRASLRPDPAIGKKENNTET